MVSEDHSPTFLYISATRKPRLVYSLSIRVGTHFWQRRRDDAAAADDDDNTTTTTNGNSNSVNNINNDTNTDT